MDLIKNKFAHARKWVLEFEGTMNKEQRDALKKETEESGFEMVKKYQDKSGRTRV